MKKQRFRLGTVLKHYALQKQRAAFQLQQSTHALREIEAEIAQLNEEISAVAALMSPDTACSLTTAGWLACCRQSEHLGRRLANAGARLARQAEVVSRCQEQRK